jgi:hypothetical protein
MWIKQQTNKGLKNVFGIILAPILATLTLVIRSNRKKA